MKFKHLLFGSILISSSAFAQVQNAGDIAFTGFNADGDDDLAFVTFVDIPANTTIYFCDSEWDGTEFGDDEGDFTWNSGTEMIPKGTIITLSNISEDLTVNYGSITENNAGGLGNSDEAMFAFLGTAPRTVTTMLAAIANDNSGFGTLDNSGLVLGQSAILLGSSTDVAEYTGARTGFTQNEYFTSLNNLDNWAQEAGSGDQHDNGTAPDLPFDLTPFDIEEGTGENPAIISFDTEYDFVEENAESVLVELDITNASESDAAVEINLVEGGNAENEVDFDFTSQSLTFTANSTESQTIEIPILINSATNEDRFFVIELQNFENGVAGSISQKTIYIKDNDYSAPEANNDLDIEFLTSHLIDGEGTAEIVSYDKDSQRLFVLNSTATKINILDFSNPAEPVEITSLDMSVYGIGATSVAVYNGLVAATVAAGEEADGKVVFMDINGENVSSVTVGNLPDMVTFTPDGTRVLTANEGEPKSDYTFDAEGGISVIDVSGGLGNITQDDVTTLNFNDFDAQLDELKDAGVRIFGPNASVSQDLEPEYITVSEDSSKAWVSLQENNALAVIDLTNLEITDILPLGYKDHSSAGNSLDSSDEISDIFMSNWPIKGMYMPDAIANYTVNGITYILTSNEGDARDYDGYAEEERIEDLVLDETVFPNATILQNENNLGRLNATTANGDTDNDGQYEEIYVYGGRSFSIRNGETGELVYDSGDDFERITAADPVFGEIFNADNESDEFKNRSDNKGPEPEGITVAEINEKFYAFITLERVGGIMVYDVTNPESPIFVAYRNNRNGEEGDMAPEGIIYIAPEDNSTEKGLIVVANEVSATVSVYQINNNNLSLAEEINVPQFKIYPNPVENGTIYFSKPISGEIYSMNGSKVISFENKSYLNVAGLSTGIYIVKTTTEESQKIIINLSSIII